MYIVSAAQIGGAMTIISYAQHREDMILRRALRHIDGGFYIDVGAFLPVEYSATKLFYDAGWSGINLEPCPEWFEQLVSGRPRDINLRVAASRREGEAEFYQVTDPGKGPHSTCIAGVAGELQNRGMHVATYRVPAKPLADICAEHAQADIHFLKIDVEGAEHEVLLGADFTKYRPWIIVIESHDVVTGATAHPWEPILLNANYKFGMSHDLNRFYWAAEHPELCDALRLSFDEYETREGVEERATLRQQNAELTRQNTELTQQLLAVINSASWKVTTPLRALGQLRQISKSPRWRE
jgi:FkbM family methyltransferase